MKNLIHTMIRRYAEWLIRYRIPVIVLIGIITVFLGSHLTKLRLENTPDLWAPQDHPFIKTTRLLEKVFGGRNYTLIGIVPKQGDIYRPEVLTKVRNIQMGLESLPEAVRKNVISLAAKKAKAIAGTPEGMEVHQLMERIPETPKEIARLRADIERNPIYNKAIVTPDGKAVSVIADFKVSPENANYTQLYNSIKAVVDKERDDTVDIYIGGLVVHVRWMEFYIMQMPYYFGVALLIIIIIQYLSFRTFQGMLLPIVTALLSVIWALGLMGFRGIPLDVFNMNTPILIMAVTAGHAIQILKRYYEEYRKLSVQDLPGSDKQVTTNTAIIESIVQVGPIMIASGVIAIIVFLSLKISDTAMTRRFGELAATGILAGLITELTFIPTLRSFLRPPKWHAVDKESRTCLLDRLLMSLSNALVGKKAAVIFMITIGAILLIFSGVSRLRNDNTLSEFYSPSTELRKDDAALNGVFGGTNSIVFLVEGKDKDALKDPKVLRGMVALQTFLDAQPHVGKTQSLADLIKRMNRAMQGDKPSYDTIPDNQNLIAQYLLLYSLSGEPQDFDNFVDNDYRRGAIWVYIKTDSTAYASELYARAQLVIKENFPDNVSVRLGGSLPQSIAINDVIVNEKLYNMLQMAVVLFLLSSLILGSFIGGLFVLTPLVCVVMANFGAMGWLGIPLETSTALSATLAIAIGADYELYLMFRMKEELARTQNLLTALRDSFLTAGKSIVLAAMSVAGGYSILITSDFAFYQRFSVVVMVTMFVSVVSTIILLRSMMMIFKPRFVFGDQRETLFHAAEAGQKNYLVPDPE